MEKKIDRVQKRQAFLKRKRTELVDSFNEYDGGKSHRREIRLIRLNAAIMAELIEINHILMTGAIEDFAAGSRGNQTT